MFEKFRKPEPYQPDPEVQRTQISFEDQRAAAEKAHADYQRGKLALALLQNDPQPIGERTSATSNQEEEIIQKIANGEITDEDASNILAAIKSPVDEKGANEVSANLSRNMHEWKILSFTLGEDFKTYNSYRSADFLGEFPTPIDFEQTKQDFLRMIKEYNPPQKYREYVDDMDAFCRHIYGKRQEYYERYLELAESAHQYRSSKTEELISQLDRKPPLETEQNHEAFIKDCAMATRSKSEIRGVQDGRPNEDNAYMNKKQRIFAVFDGVGGLGRGDVASRACVNAMSELFGQNNPDINLADSEDRIRLTRELNSKVSVGAATCVIIQIERDEKDGLKLNYVSIGDSRLYLIRNGEAQQITKDDSVTEDMLDRMGIWDSAVRKQQLEHGIANSLGGGAFHGPKSANNGSRTLRPGDKIMLCSDGITGDTSRDRMSDGEIVRVIEESKNCEVAVQNLINHAKKFDDRTAIVVEV